MACPAHRELPLPYILSTAIFYKNLISHNKNTTEMKFKTI